jgi:exosome complex component RRP42
MCGAELRPVAGRKYEPGPPSPQSIELGRVVDRGIRESGCIDMESLCIVPGEKVWGVMIDIHVMSDQGNIFDACGLAAIAALRTAVVPAERFDVGEDHTLQVNGTPIMASFTRVGGRFVLDANEQEELGGDERIHITLGDKGHLHSLQKGLKGVFTPAEFAEIFDVAQKRCVELRELVAEKEGN